VHRANHSPPSQAHSTTRTSSEAKPPKSINQYIYRQARAPLLLANHDVDGGLAATQVSRARGHRPSPTRTHRGAGARRGRGRPMDDGATARRDVAFSLRAEAHTVPAARARRCECVPPCVTFRGRRGIPSWSPGLKRPDRRMKQGRRRGAGARGGRRMLYMDRLPCVVSAWARQIAARSPPGTDTSESPVTGCCEDETFEAEQTRSAQP